MKSNNLFLYFLYGCTDLNHTGKYYNTSHVLRFIDDKQLLLRLTLLYMIFLDI